MCKLFHFILSALLIVLSYSVLYAQNDTSVVTYGLDSTEFVGYRQESVVGLGKDSQLSLDMDLLSALPKFLGNTDPVQLLKYMPGVQTSSDFDSGINVRGCDASHNEISLNGVPLYGVAHLFGIFSVFNPSHFKSFDFDRSPEGYSTPAILGSSIDMKVKGFEDRPISGEINMGLMSSQGTLSWKASDKIQLHLSARRSYMNLLYKRFMAIGPMQASYGFGDYNFGMIARPNASDQIGLDIYYGNDRVKLNNKEASVGFDFDVAWGNMAASIYWQRLFDDGSSLRQTVFNSAYNSSARVMQNQESILMPSHIMSTGYRAAWKSDYVHAGANLTYYHVGLQYPMFEDTNPSEQERQEGYEFAAYGGYKREYGNGVGFSAGARLGGFVDPERRFHPDISPSASLWFDSYSFGRFSLSYAWQHQFIFKTGMSNIGLPLDFWFLTSKYSKPQGSHTVDLSYNVTFLDGMLALDAGLYYKYLQNQVEYSGTFLDFYTSVYDLDKCLLKGEGHNFGFNFMLQKTKGKFTGWISYSVGRSLRRFNQEGYDGFYPSNHERIHELNLVAALKLGKWDLSASMVFASGLPFTPPLYFYITSGQIVTVFGEHNSARMRPYFRMDLSASYSFIRKANHDFGMNLSIYNVIGYKNDVMYTLTFNKDDFKYGPMSFALRFLPSISLYYKF